MKTLILSITGVLILLPQLVFADNSPCAINQLSFLAGKWKGTGTYQLANSTISTFQSTETIVPALNGKIFQMEGLQTLPPGSRIVNHALTTIAVDQTSGSCVFDSYVDPGTPGTLYHGIYPLTVSPEGFVWFQSTQPGHQIRYTMTINTKGQWYEIGESSQDGTAWTQFFSQTLDKE